jgi:RNA-binding protein
MKKLGTVSHISNKGKMNVRSHKTPGFGISVFTHDKKRLGIVHDIFGPTKKPYISVKLNVKNSKNLENRVGETLYILSKPVKIRGRKPRRKK